MSHTIVQLSSIELLYLVYCSTSIFSHFVFYYATFLVAILVIAQGAEVLNELVNKQNQQKLDEL